MKAILKFTVSSAFMFATVAGTATETNKASVVPFSDTELEILEAADKGKPIFRKKGEKVFLNMLNLQGDRIEIKVFDGDRRLLFKEIVEGDLTVEKAFNFENAFEDSYTVIVKDSDGVYTEKINVR